MFRTFAAVIALVLSAAILAEDVALPAPPLPVKQAEIEKLIKEIYKDEYAKSLPAEKQALSQKLVQQVAETKDDPASVYVLLKEASTLAAQAGDPDAAIALIDRMAAQYRCDAAGLKKAALAAATPVVRDPEIVRSLAARKVLLDKPDDPVNSLILGKYLCFTKADWNAGLPFLAAGNDSALKALAETELQKPADATAQLALADAWWDLADKQQAKAAKMQYLWRAQQWYQQSLPNLSGLFKMKAEKRLGEINAQLTSSPKAANASEIASCQGCFYLSVDDSAMVYLNGQKIHEARDESRTREVLLKDGDVVVVQIQGAKRGHRFLMAFQSTDNRWEIPLTGADYRDLTRHSLNSLTAATVSGIKEKVNGNKAQRAKETDKLTQLGLLEVHSEWINGREDKCQIGFVVQRSMFKPTKPERLADPMKHAKP